MAYTAAEEAELQAAIATGARSITHEGKRVEFRDLDEMRALLLLIQAERGTIARPRRRLHVVGFR